MQSGVPVNQRASDPKSIKSSLRNLNLQMLPNIEITGASLEIEMRICIFLNNVTSKSVCMYSIKAQTSTAFFKINERV